jgi:phosphinothricin acetyltransferase
MIGVIDAENQSITFHENLIQNRRNYKESGFKFDRWLHSVFMQLI